MGRLRVAFDVETIFASNDHLYLGAETGMYIISLQNPARPYHVGQHWHQKSCDPVVVSGSFAYVTLKAGGSCGFNSNVPEIIDVSNPLRPILRKTYPMTGPTGLGIDGSRLFVCDGNAGLKVFDISDPIHIVMQETVLGQFCNDLIPNNGLLVVTSNWGIFQYDYRQEQLELLSMIPWGDQT